MTALGKLGVLASIISALLANVGSTPATTASYSPAMSVVGELSGASAVDDLEGTLRALRLARVELETAGRIAKVGLELYGDPAFLAYVSALTPVLKAADQISEHLSSLDVGTVLSLAYGLASARTALEGDVGTLPNWLLVHQAVNPESRFVSPPARFIAASTDPLFSDARELAHADLTPPLLG